MIITQIGLPVDNKENMRQHPRQLSREQKNAQNLIGVQDAQPQLNPTKKKKSSIIENILQQTNNITLKQDQKRRQSLNKVFHDMSLETSPVKENHKAPNTIQIFDNSYAQSYDQNLLEFEPDFSNCLKGTQIKESLRAKMVDWIIEVFGNYSTTSNHDTFFRALGIMDLFLKKSGKNFQSADLHLIGVASMFIASKTEDIYHISLTDIVSRVGHDKFTKYCYIIFNEFENDFYQPIIDSAIYLLKQCMHDYKTLNIKPHLIAISLIQISVTTYFEAIQSQFNPHIDEVMAAIQAQQIQQSRIEQNIQGLCDLDEQKCFNEAANHAKKITMNFSVLFPDLHNLERFCL